MSESGNSKFVMVGIVAALGGGLRGGCKHADNLIGTAGLRLDDVSDVATAVRFSDDLPISGSYTSSHFPSGTGSLSAVGDDLSNMPPDWQAGANAVSAEARAGLEHGGNGTAKASTETLHQEATAKFDDVLRVQEQAAVEMAKLHAQAWAAEPLAYDQRRLPSAHLQVGTPMAQTDDVQWELPVEPAHVDGNGAEAAADSAVPRGHAEQYVELSALPSGQNPALAPGATSDRFHARAIEEAVLERKVSQPGTPQIEDASRQSGGHGISHSSRATRVMQSCSSSERGGDSGADGDCRGRTSTRGAMNERARRQECRSGSSGMTDCR